MKQVVTMFGYMGRPMDVEGYLQSGLLIHKTGKTWMISHVASGCSIGPGDRSYKDCIARRARLLEVLADWTACDMSDLAKAAHYSDTAGFAHKVREVAY